MLAALTPAFRCITLDFPGSGLSGGSAADVDLASFPAVLDTVLEACGVEQATFVIHDLGGVVGVTSAAARPSRVTGIVASNSFAWAPDRRALRLMLRLIGSSLLTATLGTLRLVPRLTSTGNGVGRHFDDADRTAFLGPYRDRIRSRNFHRAMRSARRHTRLFADAERALGDSLSQVPVLTVFGERNDPFGFADRWQSLFPRAHRWTVEDGNHFPMCDEPAAFAERLKAWHEAEVADASGHRQESSRPSSRA